MFLFRNIVAAAPVCYIIELIDNEERETNYESMIATFMQKRTNVEKQHYDTIDKN
jgi:hypothetical protein